MPSKRTPIRRASRSRRPTFNVKKSSSRDFLIFISHSTQDRWIARQIASLLEASQDITTFLDERDIEVGDSIPESIRGNIQECDEFVVLLTKNSINRPWVLIEISAAWGQNKRIIAIIDKVAPEEMPEIMLPYKAVDLNNLEEYIRQVRDRVKGASS